MGNDPTRHYLWSYLDARYASCNYLPHSIQMKAKIAVIIDECVDNGVDRGWARAHKHNESPTEIQIKSHIKECVMSQIYEYFSFEEGEV